MSQDSRREEQARVLDAFDTLFNKCDYAAGEPKGRRMPCM